METLLTYLFKEIEKPVGYCAQWKERLKLSSILNYSTGNQEGLASERIDAHHEYERLRDKCRSAKTQEDIGNLNVEYKDFENKFKTEEERYKDSQENELDKKELSSSNKELKEAMGEIREECAKRIIAGEKHECYEYLIKLVEEGKLPTDVLKNLDVKNITLDDVEELVKSSQQMRNAQAANDINILPTRQSNPGNSNNDQPGPSSELGEVPPVSRSQSLSSLNSKDSDIEVISISQSH